ncbi:MAG TPA: glycine cleavage system protein GcvH [Acidimicrobiia bacterium]|nr:glycine cleavage system protein GcvH [Acidimicrobiia bacterium]
MSVPQELRYSREHEWVRVDGTTARVGITDFAQESLGDVVFVQLPDVGLEIVAGASAAEIESTKSVSDVYVPVSGIVEAINETLVDTPELVNQDPYGAGWILAVTLSDPAELDGLLDANAYSTLVGED